MKRSPPKAAEGRSADPAADASAAVLDSIRALMLIRAYRIRGPPASPISTRWGCATMPDHGELDPQTYGFTAADMDRPIFIDNVLGLESRARCARSSTSMKRTYCGTFALQYMHISNPEAAAWLKERIEGYGKEIAVHPRRAAAPS